MPTTQKAVYLSKADGAVVRERPSDGSIELGDKEILIKNVAVASNPKDWKLSKWGVFEGVEGNDIAGYVEKIGSGVTAFKVGDKVGSFTPMRTHDKFGAYQATTVTTEHTSFLIGDKTSFDQAAALPLAVLTAAIGLFVDLKLPEPNADGKPTSTAMKTGILIWGAGSAVGGYAVQLSKKAGLYVVAVAGSSVQHAKDLGADVVINYKTDDVASAIEKAAQKVSITHAYDAISEAPTTETIVKVLGRLKGGIVTTVLPTDLETKESDQDTNVKVVRTMVGKAHAEESAFAEKWIRQIAQWVNEGNFNAGNVKVISGGLDGVPEGLKLLEEGKVNATKLVYHIEDTK